ncbi:MAG: hypothetical protein HWE10_09350 [Gammaproteobacteria bacterium]|nr:hypothetical protein [Gammaproteobacteria bacterium]
MKRNNVLLASLIATGLMMTSVSSIAKPEHKRNENVQKQMIKVKAEQGDNVVIRVGKDGVRNSYEFTYQELENLDNISAQLDDLEPSVKEDVLVLLSKVGQLDAEVVELKNAEIIKSGKESTMSMIKTISSDNAVRIEIDVDGDGDHRATRHHIAKLMGHEKGKHKGKHKQMMKREHKDVAKFITKLINKAELSNEQVEQIRAALDAK